MGQPAFDYRGLSIQDRLELIGDIWDSIVTEAPEAVPVTAEQRAELDQRLADAEANPDDVVSWDEVRQELERGR
jgi:putative addiction module component (TIGR02574 family)